MASAPSAYRLRILALQERTFEFACAVITAYPPRSVLDEPSRIIWRELVKSAGSSTFNLEEADAASSDADFLAKMRIALREVKEARVAIRMIVRCKLAGWRNIAKYEDEAMQLALIFGKIIVNKKASMTARNS
jgi:four helix bundle protein